MRKTGKSPFTTTLFLKISKKKTSPLPIQTKTRTITAEYKARTTPRSKLRSNAALTRAVRLVERVPRNLTPRNLQIQKRAQIEKTSFRTKTTSSLKNWQGHASKVVDSISQALIRTSKALKLSRRQTSYEGLTAMQKKGKKRCSTKVNSTIG